MKNFLIIASFVLIIPFSPEDSNNTGCNNSKKENSEYKEKNNQSEKDKDDMHSSSGNHERLLCYPYIAIE
jgi:hypothetical protein